MKTVANITIVIASFYSSEIKLELKNLICSESIEKFSAHIHNKKLVF